MKKEDYYSPRVSFINLQMGSKMLKSSNVVVMTGSNIDAWADGETVDF